jgi:bacterioferritin-associated ferredoxin
VSGTAVTSEASDVRDLVCHCRRVPYSEVAAAIENGAETLAKVQEATDACTRCFGCRFELEQMLEDRLGDRYRRTPSVSLVSSKTGVPRVMYMPVLEGFDGHPVNTRILMFNSPEDEAQPSNGGGAITVRLDLIRLDGRRLAARELTLSRGGTAIVEASGLASPSALDRGAGMAKLVIQSEQVGSCRPYFQLHSPDGVTSTHEKKAARPKSKLTRHYHWLFPVGHSFGPQEAWMILTNTQSVPMVDQELIWQSDTGAEARAPVPPLERDQTALIPLHEHFSDVAAGGIAGAVRLAPPSHKVAGFMLLREPGLELWRVQHL